jgi:hypothetical protein
MSKSKQIAKKHGSVEEFSDKAKKWVQKLPPGYLDRNKDLRKLHDKPVDWEDPMVLAIVDRKFTSVDHANWVSGVVNRINRMIEDIMELKQNLPASLSDDNRKKAKSELESSLDFMRSVRRYAERNLHVTENQLEALNKTYKRYRGA